jgi:transposase
MEKTVLSSFKIHTDDTKVPVRDVRLPGKTREGHLWVYSGYNESGPSGIVYKYTPNRQYKWVREFLKDYHGYIQADAFQGYDILYDENKKKAPAIEVACMAHARRKFFDIAKNSKKSCLAATALNYLGKLYKIERAIKDLDPIAKRAIRKRKAKPILKEYKKWLLRKSLHVLPKNPLGKAINYSLKHWPALTRYLANGMLDIDNNKAERLMRVVAVGRSNWLFAGSDRGGHAAAVIYSLIETCKLNHLNPYDYLRDVLARLPNTLMRDIDILLPQNWKPLYDTSGSLSQALTIIKQN